MEIKSRSLTKEFVVLNPSQQASVELADAGLYQRLDEQYDDFKGHDLVACHEFTQDWQSWEMHPKGDEVVVLLSGKVTLVLQLEGGNQSLTLDRQGDYVIVPQGVWHTAKINEAAKLMFITPGEGTINSDRPL